jgi:hypothetical protein
MEVRSPLLRETRIMTGVERCVEEMRSICRIENRDSRRMNTYGTVFQSEQQHLLHDCEPGHLPALERLVRQVHIPGIERDLTTTLESRPA